MKRLSDRGRMQLILGLEPERKWNEIALFQVLSSKF